METIVLVIHLLIAVALIGMILLQRSEGGGLGIGGGSSAGGGLGGMMSARGTANLLTRTTAILAAGFMCTSLLLAIFASNHTDTNFLDQIEGAEVFNDIRTDQGAEEGSEAPEAAAPQEPAEPQVPIAE